MYPSIKIQQIWIPYYFLTERGETQTDVGRLYYFCSKVRSYVTILRGFVGIGDFSLFNACI